MESDLSRLIAMAQELGIAADDRRAWVETQLAQSRVTRPAPIRRNPIMPFVPDGRDTLGQWLSHFEFVCHSWKASDQEMLCWLHSSLPASVTECYRYLPLAAVATYEQVKRHLQIATEGNPEMCRRRFYDCKPSDTESATAYTARKRRLALEWMRAARINEEQLLDYLICDRLFRDIPPSALAFVVSCDPRHGFDMELRSARLDKFIAHSGGGRSLRTIMEDYQRTQKQRSPRQRHSGAGPTRRTRRGPRRPPYPLPGQARRSARSHNSGTSMPSCSYTPRPPNFSQAPLGKNEGQAPQGPAYAGQASEIIEEVVQERTEAPWKTGAGVVTNCDGPLWRRTPPNSSQRDVAEPPGNPSMPLPRAPERRRKGVPLSSMTSRDRPRQPRSSRGPGREWWSPPNPPEFPVLQGPRCFHASPLDPFEWVNPAEFLPLGAVSLAGEISPYPVESGGAV